MTTPPAPTPDPDAPVDGVVDPAVAAGAQPPSQEDQGAPEVSLELPFKLDEIDDDFTLTGEDARRFLQTRQAQMQAGLTRKTQELAAQRASVASLAELQTALDSDDPEVWRPAMNELLARKEFALPDDDVDVEPDPDPDQSDVERELAELKAWKDQQESAAQTAAQQREQADREAAWNSHVVTSMDKIATETFNVADANALPEDVAGSIVQQALLAPRLADGNLDFDAGLAKHLELEEVRRARYLASKDVPLVAGGGSSGVPAPAPLKTTEDRLKRAAAVAGRHYSS